MGGFTVECDGEFIEMPFDRKPDGLNARRPFSKQCHARMDENRFKLGFEKHCVSTVYGKGRYCHAGLLWARPDHALRFISSYTSTRQTAAAPREQENIRNYKAGQTNETAAAGK